MHHWPASRVAGSRKAAPLCLEVQTNAAAVRQDQVNIRCFSGVAPACQAQLASMDRAGATTRGERCCWGVLERAARALRDDGGPLPALKARWQAGLRQEGNDSAEGRLALPDLVQCMNRSPAVLASARCLVGLEARLKVEQAEARQHEVGTICFCCLDRLHCWCHPVGILCCRRHKRLLHAY